MARRNGEKQVTSGKKKEKTMYTVIVGVIMLVVFMTLILTKRVSTLTALVIVPVVFGFIAGYGTETFKYAMYGMISVILASCFVPACLIRWPALC